MASPKLYEYRGSIVALKSEQILSAFEKLELDNRQKTNEEQGSPGVKLQYLSISEVAKNQAMHMKANWSKNNLDLFKEIVRKVSGGKTVSSDFFMQSMQEFLELKLKEKIEQAMADAVAPQILPRVTRALRSRLAANVSLSSILGISPDPTLPREKINFNGSTIRWQVSQKPVRMVVEKSSLDCIDLHVFAFYDETLDRCWTVGHADKKTMSECAVEMLMGRECHCLPFSGMAPMSMFLERLKIESVPNGVFIEKVPNSTEIPITTTLTVPEQTTHDPGDDFYKIIESKSLGEKNS